MIAIPESVRFYWHDAVNRAALNVLAGGGEVPPELSWSEAERFELAQLAAHRVRVEYRGLLRALWSASWEAAVRSHLPGAKLVTFGEHRDFALEVDPYATVTVEDVWEEGAVSGVFSLPDRTRLFKRLALTESDSAVELAFYHYGAAGSTTVSDGLDLGPGWTDDGEDRRITVPGAPHIDVSGGSIEPALIAEPAQSAAMALAQQIR